MFYMGRTLPNIFALPAGALLLQITLHFSVPCEIYEMHGLKFKIDLN